MTFKFEAPPPASPDGSPDPSGAGKPSGPPLSRNSGEHAIERATAKRRALLVGNPNVGKSVLFGALTGTYVTVSNYPGTTVEVTRGHVSFDKGEAWELLDTPGTNNLVPMSEDEAVTRDILLSEPSDVLVQVGDAKNLARTLLLTLQLAELGVPFLLDLNMADEARSRGITIDLEALTGELAGVRVNTSAAIHGEGVEPVRAYLAERGALEKPRETGLRDPLPCAPPFPDDVEAAIGEIEASLPSTLGVAKRGVATMLLSGDRGFGGWLDAHVDATARARAGELSEGLAKTHGVPGFALLSKLRLARAQAIVRTVQRRDDAHGGARARGGAVPWPRAIVVGFIAALIAAVTYDGALLRTATARAADPLDDYGFFDIVGRFFSRELFTGWSPFALAFLGVATGLGAVLVHAHASARAAAWKLVAAFAIGYSGYWVTGLVFGLALHSYDARPVHIGAFVGLAALAVWARAGDRRDAVVSGFLGRYATHPRWGVPILFVVLFFAYKVVGVFGAGTAVDFLENKVFGSIAAEAPLDVATDVSVPDVKPDGTIRLVVEEKAAHAFVRAEVKQDGSYVPDPTARVDVYPAGKRAPINVITAQGTTIVGGILPGAVARVWTGYLNRWAYSFFLWVGVPLVTAFFVGPYGILTMGVTYAVAIVLPVVATFFFVFSMLEDSGYLPRLAVMANRQLRAIGLNGKAVLPMVLGLGCDTMATLTARIMETKKERVLVTLLLALGIPCSSQLSVIFAMMQRTSRAATIVWVIVVLFTIGFVGWIAAKVVPGDKSDFLLEMPPIRRPQVGNLIAKTMARIEWYLREAVPLFLAGTAMLFFLDLFNLLQYVHRAGEPVVHHLLGFERGGGVSDKVSEALLVGFLRRDFGAAGLLDMARGGHLSTGDVAVSMVVITLFIPCIANVFMIVKERGWKVAGMMSAFIFPYAVLIGGLVRLLFNGLAKLG